MKKNVIKTLAMAVGIMLLSFSCTKDEPGQNIDKDTIERLSRSSENRIYQVDHQGADLYYMEPGSSKWVKNTESIMGDWPGLPYEQIVFLDGKVITEVPLFSLSTGPYPVAMLWDALRKETGEKRTLYSARQFIYDEDANSLYRLCKMHSPGVYGYKTDSGAHY